nr:hypothetical protein [Methylomarinum sp. Ch1-1]MDP4521091.1 hypothetical protein [Methylomarinum sp. Ch1-1]
MRCPTRTGRADQAQRIRQCRAAPGGAGYLTRPKRSKSARRRPALGPNGSFRAEGGDPTQSNVLPSDVSNYVKRIKNRCASYRQHTLPVPVDHSQRIRQCRAASRRLRTEL